MSSFFGKLRSSAVGSTPSAASSPAKKDPNAPQPTPLEKLLENLGPVRNDGSDKYFGMENFGNTCYCNSILQCLYYSVPFREQVINYPKRTPLETIHVTPPRLPRINTSSTPQLNGAMSPARAKTPTMSPSTRNTAGPGPPPKPEDKESPEYKKKQAMLNGPILPMNYDNAPSYGMTESLFSSLKDIFEAIIATQSRTGVVSPGKFLEVLRKENEMFRSSMHQDAHEFLNLLLNEVVANVEANAKKIEADKGLNGSAEHGDFEKALALGTPSMANGARSPNITRWVHELFEGTLTSETKCLTCENVSQRDEAFLDLSVDLDQHSSVTSCLRKFSEEEMLCERNKFHCDRCGGLQEAEKRMKIKRLPKILALHLKRFKYSEDLQRLQKLFHRVVYPYHLRLFNTTDDAEDPDRLYELYAVVVHIGGGPYHGHYVSIVKTEDRGWLLFDDEMVEPVDKSFVRNFFGERPGLACAYVLFYQETTLEAVKRDQDAEGLAAAEQVNVASKEGVGLGIKTNGHVRKSNELQSAKSPTSPFLSEAEPWDNSLDKAATAHPISSYTPETMTTANDTFQPPISSLPDHLLQSKKERQKEEKSRRATEKENERLEKARVKDDGTKTRKDFGKILALETKAAVEASKATKADEDRRAADAGLVVATPDKEKKGGLNRFRPGSRSISKKPKFWTHKESNRDENPFVASPAITDGEDHSTPAATAGLGLAVLQPTTTVDKPEKEKPSKIRFASLRKKKEKEGV